MTRTGRTSIVLLMADEKASKKDKVKNKATVKTETAVAAGEGAGGCQIAKCKQPVRAKGLCRKHFMGWRRGKVGKKHRYRTCGKEGCRKPVEAAGFCGEHRKAKAGAAEAAAAPAPVPAAPAGG